MGVSSKAEAQRTACTRQIHFIYWCTIRGITDTIFPVTTLSPTGVMYMMAIYAASLATGNAIALKSIKSGTVQKDLSETAELLRNFDNDRNRNVYKTNGTMAYPISCITNEMK